MLSARNIENGQIRFDDFRYIGDASFAVEHARTRVAPGDVLLTIVGTIGRTAVVPKGMAPFALQRSVAVLSPKQDLLPRFLSYQLQSPTAQRYFEANARGTAQKGIYLKLLGEAPIGIPSLNEQREIVAEIEKQFSRLDETVASLSRVKIGHMRYKAALLAAAVAGRLVPTEAEVARREGRSVETGSQHLARILERRRIRFSGKGKYKEPIALPQGDLTDLPDGWIWCGLEQVSAAEKHALKAGPFGSALKKDTYVESGYKIYGQEQVIRGDPYFGDYYISAEKYRELESCAVRPGDVLVSLVGTAGKVLVLPEDSAPGIINPRLIKLSLDTEGIEPKYAALVLQSPVSKHFFKLQAHGGTMEILNLGILKALPIPLPPFVEQHRIVAEVERCLSLVDEVADWVDTGLRRAIRLRREILQQAFAQV